LNNFLKAFIKTTSDLMVDISITIGKIHYGFVAELPFFERFIGILVFYSLAFLILVLFLKRKI